MVPMREGLANFGVVHTLIRNGFNKSHRAQGSKNHFAIFQLFGYMCTFGFLVCPLFPDPFYCMMASLEFGAFALYVVSRVASSLEVFVLCY